MIGSWSSTIHSKHARGDFSLFYQQLLIFLLPFKHIQSSSSTFMIYMIHFFSGYMCVHYLQTISLYKESWAFSKSFQQVVHHIFMLPVPCRLTAFVGKHFLLKISVEKPFELYKKVINVKPLLSFVSNSYFRLKRNRFTYPIGSQTDWLLLFPTGSLRRPVLTKRWW